MPEGTNFSLVDLKALSEPACKLVEAVRSAVGIVYDPTRIRREAKARSDAEIIIAEGREALSDLEYRASERRRNREMRRQKNIESITRGAMAALPDKVSDEKIDEDWIHNFFETCQDVGADQMQSIWSKILAGEVTSPGTFSARCLRTVKDFTVEDANDFTKLVECSWTIGFLRFPLFFNAGNSNLKEYNLSFFRLTTLDTIGLISFDNSTPYFLSGDAGREVKLSYYGENYKVKLPDDVTNFNVGHVLFTQIGLQLLSIAGGVSSSKHRDFTIEQMRLDGLTVEAE